MTKPFKLPEGFKFPEGWGTIENSEKMPDGSFMDYVSVPKRQYDALVQRLEQAEKDLARERQFICAKCGLRQELGDKTEPTF